MKTTDFYIKPKAKTLNESLSQKFGESLDIDNYSTKQLQKAAGLIESKINNIKNSKFNETLNSEEFHRLKLMHDVVKTALSERAVSKSQQQAAGAALAAKRKGTTKGLKGASKEMSKMSTKELEKYAGTKHKGLPKKVGESSKAKPDYLDFDKDGNKAEPMKKALKDKKHKKVAELGPATLGSYATKVAKLEPHQVKPSREKGIVQATQKLRKKEKGTIKESWDDDWVNSKRPNFKVSVADMGDWDQAQEKVLAHFKKNGHRITDIDDSADPVIVLMSGDTPVGWYDYENAHGYMEKNPVSEVYEGKRLVNESYIAIGRFLMEGEEGKAELIMAVKDMVDKFTGWSEDIAQMQAQTAMEMADAIRDEMGSDAAEQFTTGVQPSLDAAFQAVKAAREALNNQVGTLTGNAPEPMGAEPEADMDADTGADAELPSDEELPVEPDAETPPEGREKRESIERRNRLAKLLVNR